MYFKIKNFNLIILPTNLTLNLCLIPADFVSSVGLGIVADLHHFLPIIYHIFGHSPILAAVFLFLLKLIERLFVLVLINQTGTSSVFSPGVQTSPHLVLHVELIFCLTLCWRKSLLNPLYLSLPSCPLVSV